MNEKLQEAIRILREESWGLAAYELEEGKVPVQDIADLVRGRAGAKLTAGESRALALLDALSAPTIKEEGQGEDPAEWVRLADLRPGAIFETADGIRAVKSEYHYPWGGIECTLLASGERAAFASGADRARRHNETKVREIDLNQALQILRSEA